MIEQSNNDLTAPYKKMEKFDFNKELTVSVSIIESDHNVEEPEQLMDNTNTGNTTIDMDTRQETSRSDQITSIFFDSAHKDHELNNNNCNEKLYSNSALIPPQFNNKSAETHNKSQKNMDSWIKELLVPQDQNLSLRPISASSTESAAIACKTYNDLKCLANHIINILKSYNYYIKMLDKCGNNEVLKKKCNEDYIRIKQSHFRVCSFIVMMTVLPLGENFNMQEFIHKTISIAKPEEKSIITYENVHRVYSEIIGSCYKPLSREEVMQGYYMNTNVPNNEQLCPLQSLQSMQNNFQNHRHRNNIHNGHQTIMQQNCQYNVNSNNFVHRGNKGTYKGHYNIVSPTDEHNSIVQQDAQSNWYSSNLTQTVNNNNSFNSAYQTNLRDTSHNIAQTNFKEPSSVLQETSKEKQKMMNNGLKTVLQDLLMCDKYYNYKNQIINNQPNSISDQNNKNYAISPQSIDHKRTNSTLKQNVEISQNYSNKALKSSDSKISDVPVCVFEYTCPEYELRFHLNSQLLNDANSSNQNNNGTDIPSDAKKQRMSSDIQKPQQSIESSNSPNNQISYQGVSPVLQEPTRSTSRESHLMSPCNNQLNGMCNGEEAQDPSTPYITDVTSLNPKAKQIPTGACYVCGHLTNKKCLGCYKNYYCTNECQKRHWYIHKFECGNKGLT